MSRSRRHQIPGLRQTPYLKVLFVRCDDSESYKSHVRAEIREWVKSHAFASGSSKKSSASLLEAYDAFEWLIVHVVLPNTTAATQPRVSKTSDTIPENKTSSKWKGGSSTLLEKLRSDFNGTGKHSGDRVAQVRVGINDVPYDMLPRVVPAVPSGYLETEQDVQGAWMDLVDKLKSLILMSFDMRVTRYEDDIKERDAQRVLPGWNFCTFFILKEGLARGFESVGLVEDALVGYDELSVGLDSVMTEQAISGSPESHGGALLPFTDDLKKATEKALGLTGSNEVDEEAVDLQTEKPKDEPKPDDIPIISSKKPYREMILANNVSLFDFRCYIFSRQISLLLRLGNAWSTREELLAKLIEQQESVLRRAAPRAPPPKQSDQAENLAMLAEICRRTLEFIPIISQAMRGDILTAMVPEDEEGDGGEASDRAALEKVADNIVASFAFSVVQQVLAQTSTRALPIPPSTLLLLPDAHEPKSFIPEPKTMMHPARSSSLNMAPGPRRPPSPNMFPVPGRPENSNGFLKTGLLELAARRAELYSLSRNILERIGRKKGWVDKWGDVPILGDNPDPSEMEDVNLDANDDKSANPSDADGDVDEDALVSASVASNRLLSVAVSSKGDFQRLYETLTDKALRHYAVAEHDYSVRACLADLGVLKYQLGEYDVAATYFGQATPFFGACGWSLVELSLLIMFCRCLKELEREEMFFRVAVKLLHMAALAARENMEQSSRQLQRGTSRVDLSATRGLVQDVLSASAAQEREATVLLGLYFCNIDICGDPDYHESNDGFSVKVRIHNLLEDAVPVEKAVLALTCIDPGSSRRIHMECDGHQVIKPGLSILTFHGKDVATGRFKVDSLVFRAQNLVLSFDRDVNQLPPKNETIFRSPPITIYQRPETLDVHLTAAKNTRLDHDNSLDLEICTGWNSVQSCQVAVKPATGGLRLLTAEASVVGPVASSETEFARPREGGILAFGAIPSQSSLTIRFPFSVEADVSTITVKLDVTFTTNHGEFHISKAETVPVSLALAVNVQDVFKHDALFSRFTVSTASDSPLRLYESELVESDAYESHFGIPPPSPVLIFPRQPATLLYKISRKETPLTAKSLKKTMFLQLHYSVLDEELEGLLVTSITDALGESSLRGYTRLLVPIILRHAQEFLSPVHLERAALTGILDTSFVSAIDWEAELPGLDAYGTKTVAAISTLFKDWQKQNRRLPIPVPSSLQTAKSIIIPVDIPSIPVLVTADIKFNTEPSALSKLDRDGLSTICVNQMLPATLHIKWTRRWATDTVPNQLPALNVSLDVTAPPDQWLIGGRRKGHLPIPASPPDSLDEGSAAVPLLLVPLREGWLPFPHVEVREVRPMEEQDEEVVHHGAHCESYFCNTGEVVRVVADRERVTISLDSSGPGGGPLVLESERVGKEGRVLA